MGAGGSRRSVRVPRWLHGRALGCAEVCGLELMPWCCRGIRQVASGKIDVGTVGNVTVPTSDDGESTVMSFPRTLVKQMDGKSVCRSLLAAVLFAESRRPAAVVLDDVLPRVTPPTVEQADRRGQVVSALRGLLELEKEAWSHGFAVWEGEMRSWLDRVAGLVSSGSDE